MAAKYHGVVDFVRFAMVGASGVIVTMAVLILMKKAGPAAELPILGIPFTEFKVRWYHVYSTSGFVVANVWNFLLNRYWTFRTTEHKSWWREYPQFLSIGLLGQGIGLLLLTALMHRQSPISLPTDLFDDSTGLRTRLYWAQLITTVAVTPVTFTLNRLWTFAHTRRAPVAGPAEPAPVEHVPAGGAH